MQHEPIAKIVDSETHGQIVLIKTELNDAPAIKLYVHTVVGTASVTMTFKPDERDDRDKIFEEKSPAEVEEVVVHLKEQINQTVFNAPAETAQ